MSYTQIASYFSGSRPFFLPIPGRFSHYQCFYELTIASQWFNFYSGLMDSYPWPMLVFDILNANNLWCLIPRLNAALDLLPNSGKLLTLPVLSITSQQSWSIHLSYGIFFNVLKPCFYLVIADQTIQPPSSWLPASIILSGTCSTLCPTTYNFQWSKFSAPVANVINQSP